jgi:hypothetical protein
MTIEQTVEIPDEPPMRFLHLDLPLPAKHPSGRVRVEVQITPVETVAIPDLEDIQKMRERLHKLMPRTYSTLEEALIAGAAQSDPAHMTEFRHVLKETHGALENSKAWGKDVDVVAEIRKMRDEWGVNREQSAYAG